MEEARVAGPQDLDELLRLCIHARHEVGAQRGGSLWLAREWARDHPGSERGEDACTEPERGATIRGRLSDQIESPTHLVVLGCYDDCPFGYGIVRVESLNEAAIAGSTTEGGAADRGSADIASDLLGHEAVAETEELRVAVVTDLYVEPEARGVGVGEAMMDVILGWCVDRGCSGIDAFALPGQRETKNFFERYGLVARAILVHRSLVPEDSGG